MAELKIWFLDVGHGDCAYIELPNGARMMIDCGCGENHWPSKLLKHYKITKNENPVSIPNDNRKYGLDNLVLTHPHGDHIADIEAIHDEIGFYLLTGGYRGFIDKIKLEQVDFRKRGQDAAKKFFEVVKKYSGEYVASKDRVVMAKPPCVVKQKRFIQYEDGIDINELSRFVSFEIGGKKILFTADMTSDGIKKILASSQKESFKAFVKGTAILKVPHHGRENGCSQELFDAFRGEPLLCIASDEILNEKNEGTSNIAWYANRTSDKKIGVDGEMQSRKVLTTRKDKDIFIQISDAGELKVVTNNFKDIKSKVLCKE